MSEGQQRYVPHKKQAEAHRAFFRQEYSRGVLLWGRQVGKTVWAVNHAWMSAVIKQGRYFIVFPTYRQAKDTIWNQYLHYIPEEIIESTNASELTITLKHITEPVTVRDKTTGEVLFVSEPHDPSLPPSTIELKGSDDAERLRGMKANGIIFDEYAIQEPEYYDTVFEPMFTTTNGWAVFISTPKGFNHFYDLVLRAEASDSWFITKATWRDNPAVDPKYIEEVRKSAEERGNLSGFMQEYELEFRSVEGAVYPEFNRDIHVVPPGSIPKDGTVFACQDFGWENPSATNFVKIDSDDNWWIFDEIHVTKTRTEDLGRMIKNKTMDQRLTLLVADSAQQESIDVMRNMGLPIIAVSKTGDSIQRGIALVGEKLKPREQLVGKPKPKLFISSSCHHTIEEFEGYRYPSKKVDRNTADVPIKNNDHHMDALRYLALHLKYGVSQKSGRIKTGLTFNEYGL